MPDDPRILGDRYRVDEAIGHGGMATVYRGQDLTLGRAVAIKILNADLARDQTFRNRFRLEAQAASRMSHPTIVRVFDAGDPADEGDRTEPPYIVMELVEGTLLKDIVARGPVPAEDAVRYVDGILQALEYSHRAGVVHRDIKPGNVMITDSGAVKVMDFGIARAVSDSSSTVAETTQIIGTAAYFSPEQAKGEPVDARTDIYSTGVVLYELLTGRQPFRGESPVAVAYQHVSEIPNAPTAVLEEIPDALDEVVLRAMEKDPYERYADAAEFRAALKTAMAGGAITTRRRAEPATELYAPDSRQAQETARSLRQLSTDTTMTRTQSGPPVAWIWAGVALLAVLLVSVLFWVVTISMRPDETTGKSRTVPDLVNMTVDQAQGELEDLDLVADISYESSADVEEDHVIRTNPEPDVTVDPGETVTLYVSTGAETTTVPELSGLSLKAAKKALKDADLTLGTVRERNDPGTKADVVLEASEESEAELPTGAAVDLVVATGTVTMQDMTGWTVEAATTQLESVKLTAQPVELDPCADDQTPNTVLSMSEAPGDVAVDATVELRYCTAPE